MSMLCAARAESEAGMQADDGRIGHQAAAASWSLSEQSMLRDGEPGWNQLTVVVVVGIAVVLATVVVAVSALILHTQRRLHGHAGTAARSDTRHTGPASQRRDDVEQVLPPSPVTPFVISRSPRRPILSFSLYSVYSHKMQTSSHTRE